MAVPAQALAAAQAAVVAAAGVLAHWVGEHEEFFLEGVDHDDIIDDDDDDDDDNAEEDDLQGDEGKKEAAEEERRARRAVDRAQKRQAQRRERQRIEKELVQVAKDEPDARKARLESIRDEIMAKAFLAREDRRALLRRLMLVSLETGEPALRGYNLTDARVRHPYPAWIPSLGGFPVLMAGVAAVAIAIAFVWMAFYRTRNLFEIVGVPPFAIHDPRIGSFLISAKRRGLAPELGLDAASEKELFARLRDANFREAYDMFGTGQADLRSLAATLGLLSGVLGFYAVHVWVLVLASTLSRRLREGLRSGLTALGLLCFVDGRALLGFGDPVHSYAFANQAPILQWLTSWEKLWVFRCVAVPVIMAACLLYASYTFVDMEERSLQNILDLLLDTEESEQRLFLAVEHCQVRREKRAEIQERVQRARDQGLSHRGGTKA